MTVLAMVGFVGLLGQLWYLQTLEGGRLQEMSDKNRIRIRPVAAPRGILFDRNGQPLVDNRPAFTLSLIPRELEDRDTVLARVSVLLKIPLAELQEAVDKVPPDSIRPQRVRRGLSLEEVTKLEERRLELPGVVVEVEPQRVYPTSTFAAHLLGYVREVNDEQMKQGRYRRGDMIGQSGLERLLDEHLRGRDGGERIEVDALGRQVQVMRREEPDPGAQVITTVDRRIQEVAERAMAGHAGAVVVMDPRDGDVLAMTSSPAFPLDRFTGTLGRDEWLELVRDPMTPLMNRALAEPVRARVRLQGGRGGRRPAGGLARARWTARTATASSTWAVGPSRTGSRAGMATWTCARPSSSPAISSSTKAGSRSAAEAITRYARAFGLGAPPGADLGGEKPGLVPTVGPRAGGRPAAGRRATP